MKFRPLGRTGMLLPELGFGCASIFGKSFFSERDAHRLLTCALEKEITFFDTSYSYGEAENRLGSFLKGLPGDMRDRILISTKCGTRMNEKGKYVHDWSPDWLRMSLDTSFSRLHVDHVGMLQLHGPRISDLTPEVMDVLHDMKRQGKTAAIGINTFDTKVIEHVCDSGAFDFVMIDYNVLRQDREPLIVKLHEKGIGVIAGASLGESLFSRRIFRVRSLHDLWYLARAFKNFRGQLVKGFRYRFLDSVPHLPGPQLALRYVLDNPCITSAVFGTANPDHLKQNAEALRIVMPDAVRERIRKADIRMQSRYMDRG